MKRIESDLRIYFKDDSISFSGVRHYDKKAVFYSSRDDVYYDNKGKLDDDELPF